MLNRLITLLLLFVYPLTATAQQAVIFKGANAQMLPQGSLLTGPGQNIIQNGDTNYIKNQGAEGDGSGSTPAGWIKYADAAAVAPVDCTGGSPTVTLTANATTPLRNLQDFSYTHAASNQQGQGFSNAFTISGADLQKKLAISFDIDTTAANYTAGDLAVYVYDVTNATLITPSVTAIPKVKNTFYTTFDSTTGTSYRLCVHQSTTAATAATSKFDNFIVGPGQLVQGAAGSALGDIGLTTSGFGTPTNPKYDCTRFVNQLKCDFFFVSGTVSATPAAINLPTGYTIDFSKLSSQSNGQQVGFHTSADPGASNLTVGSGNRGGVNFTDGSTTNKIFLTINTSSTTIQKANGSAGWNSGASMTGQFTVPVAEWAGNSSLNIGPLNGCESASSTTGTWDAAAAAGNTVYGPNGSPISGSLAASRNKVVQLQYPIQIGDGLNIKYRISGTNVWVDSGSSLFTAITFPTLSFGAYVNAIPSTTQATVNFLQYAAPGTTYNSATGALNWGVVYDAWRLDHCSPGQAVGFGLATATQSGLVTLPSSEVWITGGSGHGSTNTTVRRFTNIQINNGSAITYAASTTLGDTFTINQAGIYSIMYSDSRSASTSFMGITRNSTGLTTNVQSIAITQKILAQITNYVAGGIGQQSPVAYLNAGDILRAQDDTGMNETDGQAVQFRVAQIVKL